MKWSKILNDSKCSYNTTYLLDTLELIERVFNCILNYVIGVILTDKTEFISIKELYSYLEENMGELKDYQISNLFKDLKTLKFSENNPEEAKKAQLEQLFFDFNLIHGKNALFSDKEGTLLKVFDLIKNDDYRGF